MFTDLHDVAQVLTEHIREAVGVLDVQPGPPRDAASTADAGARITLLYLTPQPAHIRFRLQDPDHPRDDVRVRVSPPGGGAPVDALLVGGNPQSFDTANQTLYFSPDGTTGSAVALVQLQAGPTLHANDLLIV